MKNCENCKHHDKPARKEPCKSCKNCIIFIGNWEAKNNDVVKEQKQ